MESTVREEGLTGGQRMVFVGVGLIFAFLTAHSIALGYPVIKSVVTFSLQIVLSLLIAKGFIQVEEHVLDNDVPNASIYLISVYAFHGGINIGIVSGIGALTGGIIAVLATNLVTLLIYHLGEKVWRWLQ